MNQKENAMKFLVIALALLSSPAFAMDGSWFGVGGNFENLSSGGSTKTGASVAMEGGYWYLGNIAYGGSFKANFLEAGVKAYDLGAFWKAGTEDGLYGKLLAGVSFFDRASYLNSSKSFYFGLGGGFLFPAGETLKIGPEVVYRHLTAGNGGDQVSIGALVVYGF